MNHELSSTAGPPLAIYIAIDRNPVKLGYPVLDNKPVKHEGNFLSYRKRDESIRRK